jgi:hypothetical protein
MADNRLKIDVNGKEHSISFNPQYKPSDLLPVIENIIKPLKVRNIIFAGKNLIDERFADRTLESFNLSSLSTLHITTLRIYEDNELDELIEYISRYTTTTLNENKIVATSYSGEFGFVIKANFQRLTEDLRAFVLGAVFGREGVEWYECPEYSANSSVFYIPKYLEMFWMQLISDPYIVERVPGIEESSNKLLDIAACGYAGDEPTKSIMHCLFGDIAAQSETGTGAPIPADELRQIRLESNVQEAYDRYIAMIAAGYLEGGSYHRTYHQNKHKYLHLKRI